MNQQIIERTVKKLKENENALHHSWIFELDNQSREYQVFPFVFSPAIFAGSAWLTTNVLKHVRSQQNILEVGTGCGVTAIQICLRIKDCIVSACDLNRQAVINAKSNAQKFNAKVTIKQSNIFASFEGQSFDIVYWNFPFHPSNADYNQLSILEKAISDPGYKVLRTFLEESPKYLKENGFLLLGFSNLMGDIKHFQSIASEINWKWSELARIDEKGLICLIKLYK